MPAKKAKRLKVIYNDGREFNVTFSPKAQVMAEDHLGRSLLECDKVRDAYYMGWCAMTCAGLCHGSFDDFLEILEDVDKSDEADAVDPTEAGPSPDGSSGSA